MVVLASEIAPVPIRASGRSSGRSRTSMLRTGMQSSALVWSGACWTAELGTLHGIGPKALRELTAALAAHGLSFADARRGK